MIFKSKRCLKLTPYAYGEQPQDKKYIKLNTNENPYPPTSRIEKVIKSVDIDKLKLYPDPENKSLKNAIADAYNIKAENVFVGNGSDEVLSFIFPAFFNEDGKGVVYYDITYSFYPVYTNFYNIPTHIVELDNNYDVDILKIKSIDADGYIICNPNAPTGIPLSRDKLISLIEARPNSLVVVDEAYSEFSDCSVSDLVLKYDNLLVVKTFSKSYSLAGIRCGYAIGNSNLIDALNIVKNSINSYTVNRITEMMATEAIQDKEYYNKVNGEVIKTRELVSDELKKLGFRVLPSHTNFVFASYKDLEGGYLYRELKDKGILVRHFRKHRIENFIRISIGTPQEMQTFIVVMTTIINKF